MVYTKKYIHIYTVQDISKVLGKRKRWEENRDNCHHQEWKNEEKKIKKGGRNVKAITRDSKTEDGTVKPVYNKRQPSWETTPLSAKTYFVWNLSPSYSPTVRSLLITTKSGLVHRTCLTPSCLRRATGGDQDSMRWGDRGIVLCYAVTATMILC